MAAGQVSITNLTHEKGVQAFCRENETNRQVCWWTKNSQCR